MTAPETLVELAERCEKATGRVQTIERDIFAALNPALFPHKTKLRLFVDKEGLRDTPYISRHTHQVPRFTASLDAAMTLVPEGWELFKLEQHRSWPGDPRGDCWLYEAVMLELHGPGFSKSSALTFALALCAAGLRAQAKDSK